MANLIGKTVIHLAICFAGCILYHVLDSEYGVTAIVLSILGVALN